MGALTKGIILFVVATVFHWAFSGIFAAWGLASNVMLVFVAALCSVLKPGAGYTVAFMGGLFLDFFGTKLFGNNAFSFTVAACVMYTLRERFDFDGVFPQIITAFVLTAGVGILNSLLLLWFTSQSMWPGVWSTLGGCVADGLLAPAVFWGVRRWWLGNSSKRN